MNLISVLLFVLILNSTCFGFSESEFKAERIQFDKDFQTSQDKFDNEFNEKSSHFDKEFKAKQDKFNKEFEEHKKEIEFQRNLIIGLMVFMFLLIISFLTIKYLKYKKIPSVEKYLEENPSCKTDHGIECKYCGSKSIRSFGLFKADDTMRTHVCNSCGKSLYRSKMSH